MYGNIKLTIEYTIFRYTNINLLVNRFTAYFPDKNYSQGLRFILLTNQELVLWNRI